MNRSRSWGEKNRHVTGESKSRPWSSETITTTNQPTITTQQPSYYSRPWWSQICRWAYGGRSSICSSSSKESSTWLQFFVVPLTVYDHLPKRWSCQCHMGQCTTASERVYQLIRRKDLRTLKFVMTDKKHSRGPLAHQRMCQILKYTYRM